MKANKYIPVLLLLSFCALAKKHVDEKLSSEELSYQAENICSNAYRKTAASPDFKVKSGLFNSTDLTPFRRDVLTAYRNFVKKNPGVEDLATDVNNAQACKTGVEQEYKLLFMP